ncbi:hypothetical protein OG389_03720 [Streptomyces sp. NBC_00435]|uniref:hypothetical protein n=1 Tax=Streptomyces sp. NBC_00435 TaxID=2903649 RepID=UPI002E1FBC3C
MQLRRILPLSLVALLASAGCVSVGPQVSDVPARGPVPPADAPDVPDAPDGYLPAGVPGAAEPADPAEAPAEPSPPLPLGKLPATPGGGPEPGRRAARAPRPAADRHTKPAAPHRAHPPQKSPARPGHRPGPAQPRVDELCAAAEGAVPPSIVDLCIRQSGR